MAHLFFVLCLAFPSIVKAMLWTQYAIHNPQAGVDILTCGQLLENFTYCAGRVTNITCEPLTTAWCATSNMSDGGTYITKKTVIERLEETLITSYIRSLPIIMSDGSEIETMFMLHSGWVGIAIDLKDDLGNIVLHTRIRYPGDIYWHTLINGTWVDLAEGYFNTRSFLTNAEHTIRIVCRTNDFQIYFNDALEWTYTYRLPPQSITNVHIFFLGVAGELFYVNYKDGQ